MKRIIFLWIFLLSASLAISQDKTNPDNQKIISWLQQKAIPIKYVEAGHDFSDLQPLKQILKEVSVVGLGENTHGTREFFQVKHRLLEFLVKEMNFTAFALEGGYGSCQPINDYVLYGKGDLQSVMTAQGYVLWDTQELATMVEWMRKYNQRVADHKKVSFFGIDFMYNGAAKEKVLAYLQKYSAPMAASADSLFNVFLKEENLFWSKPRDIPMLKDAQSKLQKLIAYLTDNQDKLVNVSSSKEFAQTFKHVQVMDQWFVLYLPDSLLTTAKKRPEIMGENLLYVMEKEKPNAKFVVWEHNVHISNGHLDTDQPTIGEMLKKKLGDKYYSIAFEFNQGSYQSRTRSATGFGNLKEEMVSPAPIGYLSYYLSQAKKGNCLWDLRDSVDNATIKEWLSQPQMLRFFGWFNDDKTLKKVDLRKRYDSILFIEHTSATRPSKNALATVSRGEGL